MTDARDARTLARPLEAMHLSRPASSRLMLAQSTFHGWCERQIEHGVKLIWHSSNTLWASPGFFCFTGKCLAGKFFFRNLSFSLGRRTPMRQLHAITQPPSSHLRHRHHPPADPRVRDCSNSHMPPSGMSSHGREEYALVCVVPSRDEKYVTRDPHDW